MKSIDELVREREPSLEQLVRERDQLREELRVDARFYRALGTLARGNLEDHLAAFRVRAQINRLPMDDAWD